MVGVADVGMMCVLPTVFILTRYPVGLVKDPTVLWVSVQASSTLPLVKAFTNKESLTDFLGFFGFVFLIGVP